MRKPTPEKVLKIIEAKTNKVLTLQLTIILIAI